MAKTKKKTEQKKVLKEIADKLLQLMSTNATVEINEDKENDALIVEIETEEEAGLLIGSRGNTLNSLQTILGQMFKQKIGEWKRIVVNVADWREKEDERLKNLAYQAADRAKSTKEPQYLYNLTASQRRVVHMALAEDDKVETESKGENKERYLLVLPKK